MSLTPFTALLDAARSLDGGLVLDVPADWAQGRSVFGGLQGALAVRAMRAHVDAAIPLRTLQMTFIGPAAGTLRVTATVLRTGNNATHLEARISGDAGLATIVVGVFGKPRPSVVSRLPVQPAVAQSRPFVMWFITGITPAFLQHFDAKYRRGGVLYSGTRDPNIVVDVTLLDDGPPGEAQAIAVADFPPPIGLVYLTAPANGSTVTWMLEILVDRFPPARGWRIDAEMVGARDGYTNQMLTVWAGDGTPIAMGHQSMIVFG